MSAPEQHDPAEFRKERKGLLDLIWSFYDVKVLAAAVEHGIFASLIREPKDIATLARESSLSERALRTLLVCLTALELVRAEGDVYSATDKARRNFGEGPDSLASAVDWANTQFDALPRLDEALLEDRIIWDGFDHYIENPDASGTKTEQQEKKKMKAFTDVLDASAGLVAKRVLEAVDFDGSKHLLDVGGNVGGFASAILRAHDHLKATVFDLPSVAAQARARAAAGGLEERLDAVGGDFMKDAWPTGVDVVSFIRMNNSRPRDELLHLLRKAYDVLPSGGKVILFEENVLDVDKNNVPRLAIWAAVMFFMGSRGETRRLDEWMNLLEEAKFTKVQGKAGKPWGFVWGVKP